jgi:hypothetical protein
MPDVQGIERICERDATQYDEANHVGDHQDRLSAKPIDPDPDRQPEQHEGQELQRAQQPHLERVRPEQEDGGERQGDEGDLRSDLADRLPGPQFQEVAMPPQARRSGLSAIHRQS